MNNPSQAIKVYDWGIHLTFSESILGNTNKCLSSLKYAILNCVELDKSRILMDITYYEQHHFSAIEIIEIAKLIKKEKPDLNIAITSSRRLSSDNNYLFETVALSHLVPLRYFDESDKALEWLMFDENDLQY